MYRDIDKTEQTWLDKLLSVDFNGKEIIKKQISASKVFCEKNPSFVSLKFSVSRSVEKFPFRVRVPIEMTVFQKNSAPIIFLLHIIDGFINELEIFPADSSIIDIDDIDLQKIDFKTGC
jgi:hypothetical protein